MALHVLSYVSLMLPSRNDNDTTCTGSSSHPASYTMQDIKTEGITEVADFGLFFWMGFRGNRIHEWQLCPALRLTSHSHSESHSLTQ
ncbi:hypothetical protein E2C01_001524 [Portunus trituberculatus]|uniref:Uncharacterized protein n=1 Tax=Portunus trituberculatus TaxID=210409 RepID=A0A5B7CHD8_PORTR|nr:hypothetical protein [Portunus trituberculatus]